jgi:hypothetical protein
LGRPPRIAGAILHRADAATRVPEFFEFVGWAHPNALQYALLVGFSHVVAPRLAHRLFLALAIGGLGAGMLYLARALGGDPRIAIAATPLALGRVTFMGFTANLLALDLWLVGLGAYVRVRRGDRYAWIALALSIWSTAIAHAFVSFAAICFLLLLVVIDLWVQGRAAVRRSLGVLGLCALGVVLTIAPFMGAPDAAWNIRDTVATIYEAVQDEDRRNLPVKLWTSLFAFSDQLSVTDVLQLLWLGILMGLMSSAPKSELGRSFFAATIAALVAFVVLPTQLPDPVNWWGVNIRVPVMAALLAIAAASAGAKRKKLGAALVAISLLQVVLSLADLASYSRREMAGFGELLDRLPPGKKISFLHFDTERSSRYPGEPQGYLSNYYLFEKGGVVVEGMFENPLELVQPKRRMGWAPPWGCARKFIWHFHARWFDGFVARVPDGGGDAPFRAHVGCELLLKQESGVWRYYQGRRF